MKKNDSRKPNIAEERFREGYALFQRHPLFRRFSVSVNTNGERYLSKTDSAITKKSGPSVTVNANVLHSPDQWAYILAHCTLHFAFGHFDSENMPGEDVTGADGSVHHLVRCDTRLWNIACDMYVANFLHDLKFKGEMIAPPSELAGIRGSEMSIYKHLMEHPEDAGRFNFGTCASAGTDMNGLLPDETGCVYTGHYWSRQKMTEYFATCLAKSVSEIVGNTESSSVSGKNTIKECRAAEEWFTAHYPLLGGVASCFTVISDEDFCRDNGIRIAAVNKERREIYVNPFTRMSEGEWRFVLAHEYLHAGLCHGERCLGRDPWLWNVACDFVINGWLREMNVGTAPAGTLYDPSFSGMSCESVYDIIVSDLKNYRDLETFRGIGKGDILGRPGAGRDSEYASRDDFVRDALMQGLDDFEQRGRGTIPAGLAEEIRALSVPPVPWDVKLSDWFDEHFAPAEPRHTYARASRRQSATPDIPRPGKTVDDAIKSGRTFGVVIDTSGSMKASEIGYALGAAANYAVAKEVPFVRVIFCDAAAYDAGYMAPEEIAGRVEVKGRGGTVLQPAIKLLENAEDFPKDGPVLIITDGEIESRLDIRREHAFLMPQGARLPFRPRGEVFRFYEK